MKIFNSVAFFGIIFTAAFWVGCSQTASGSTSDDLAVESSSSEKLNGESSSSTKSSESKRESSSSKENSSSSVIDAENCIGDSGKAWDGTTAKNFACGNGTAKNPYVILTAEQLAYFSFVTNASDKKYDGKYFKLGADIVLNEGEIIDENGALQADTAQLHKWTSVGNSKITFSGSFDGANHSIRAMFISTTSKYNGLFGNSKGTIKNLTLKNSWVEGGENTAGVVGYNTGIIENVTNESSVTSQEKCVGGVVGETYYHGSFENSTLKNVKNRGMIVGNLNVGGIVGCAHYVTINRAENFADIQGYGFVGGIAGAIGSNSKNNLQNLKNANKITGTDFVGGIAGSCGGNLSSYHNSRMPSYYCSQYSTCGKISNAKNTASIEGKNYVGGVIGVLCSGEFSSLSNTADVVGEYGVAGVIGAVGNSTSEALYNIGNISGSTYVGGIFASQSESVSSAAYTTGKVEGDSLVGLMIGNNYNSTIADYYYLEQSNQEAFGKNDGGGVATPKSEKEMKSKNFAELLGESFAYDSNERFPILTWEQN